MKNRPKSHVLFKAIIYLLCLSTLLAIMTVGLAKAWAQIEVNPNFIVDSPTQLAPITVKDDCTILYRSLPTPYAPMYYEGRAILRWYDTVENAMWFTIETDDLYEEICLFLTDHHIPESFYMYVDRVDMYINATFADEITVNNWYLVEKATGLNLGKPNNKQLADRYELDWKYPLKKMGKQPDTIYLSKLKPNTIYSYTPNVEDFQDYPNIINDIDTPCVLYTKHHGLDPTYGVYACPEKMIAELSVSSFACAFYESGDEYRIMYTPTDSTTLHNIAQDNTINMTDLIESNDNNVFYMYIYNNTDREYQLTITADWEEYPVPEIVTMKPGDFIGCWSPAYTVTVKEKA